MQKDHKETQNDCKDMQNNCKETENNYEKTQNDCKQTQNDHKKMPNNYTETESNYEETQNDNRLQHYKKNKKKQTETYTSVFSSADWMCLIITKKIHSTLNNSTVCFRNDRQMKQPVAVYCTLFA